LIELANLRDASWITANMRRLDREETYCQLPSGTSNVDIALALVAAEGMIAYRGSDPILLFGTSPITNYCYSVWAIGTDATPRVIPEVSRFLIHTHIPYLLKRGVRSMEARSLVTHGAAHRWMESMGGERHGPAYEFGRDGEHFVTYRWTVASYRSISGSRWADAVPKGYRYDYNG
jgi:hypothetical protein